MSISASQIVSVTPRVLSAGSTDLEICGLLLTKNSLVPTDAPLSFSSARTVGDYFGYDSDEYLAAAKYFQGYDNSFKKPSRLWFANGAFGSDVAGKLIGGTAESLENIQRYTAASFAVNVDGEWQNIGGVDFSSAASYSDVAVILSAVISGVEVTYDSNLGSFIITSKTTGNDSYVGALFAYETTDTENLVCKALGLAESSGAVSSYGTKAESPAETMNGIIASTQNFVSFTTLFDADDDTVLELAEWTNDQENEYAYFPYTEDKSNLTPSSADSLIAKLAEADYDGVVLTYGNVYHAVFAMSIGASIDWNRRNGVVTWAFKSQDGLEASLTDDTDASNAKDLKVNFYGRYATRNDSFIYYYQGAMSGGDYGFIDAYIGHLWLRNGLQVSIVDGLGKAGRVPYTDAGYTQIRAWCMDPINRALLNGVIQAGVSLSESQKAELYAEIGEDVSDQFFTNGYYLSITDPGASARVNRESPTMGLWYCYGGAVHKIDLPVTVTL